MVSHLPRVSSKLRKKLAHRLYSLTLVHGPHGSQFLFFFFFKPISVCHLLPLEYNLPFLPLVWGLPGLRFLYFPKRFLSSGPTATSPQRPPLGAQLLADHSSSARKARQDFPAQQLTVLLLPHHFEEPGLKTVPTLSVPSCFTNPRKAQRKIKSPVCSNHEGIWAIAVCKPASVTLPHPF